MSSTTRLITSDLNKFLFIEVNITKACNLKCSYCCSEFIQVSLESLESIRRIPHNNICVRISGGEPTLAKNLHQVVDSVRAMKNVRRVELYTNGTRDIDASKFDYIVVSLHPEYKDLWSSIIERFGNRAVYNVISGEAVDAEILKHAQILDGEPYTYGKFYSRDAKDELNLKCNGLPISYSKLMALAYRSSKRICNCNQCILLPNGDIVYECNKNVLYHGKAIRCNANCHPDSCTLSRIIFLDV